MRTKTRWSNKEQERSYKDVATALAFNMWQAAATGLLALENDGFQVDSRKQRLDIIAEFLIYTVHSTDRLVYEKISDEDRAELITELALAFDRIFVDNAKDTQAAEEYHQGMIDKFNEICAEYADFAFSNGEPSFGYLRFFADRITDVIGPKDRKWVQDRIMQIEGPDVIKLLKKALKSLVPETRDPAPAD